MRTSRDVSDNYANSSFTIDGDTGRVTNVVLPTGERTGQTFDYWLGLLHTAGKFGLSYRIFVSAMGIVIVVLSVTGVLIWMRKRSARLLGARHRRRRNTPEAAIRVPVAVGSPH